MVMKQRYDSRVSMTRDCSLVCKIPEPTMTERLEGILQGVDSEALSEDNDGCLIEREYADLTKAVIQARNEKKQEERAARQERIASQNELLADGILRAESISGAAKAAGLTPTAASNRLRTDHVKELLRNGRKEIESVSSIKRLDVLNIFLEAIDLARTMSDPGQMINGADKVAKMMGYYEPDEIKVDVSVNYEGAMRKIRELSDVELLELAEGRVIDNHAG